MLIILGQLKVGFYTTPLYSHLYIYLPVIESVHKIQILKSKTQL